MVTEVTVTLVLRAVGWEGGGVLLLQCIYKAFSICPHLVSGLYSAGPRPGHSPGTGAGAGAGPGPGLLLTVDEVVEPSYEQVLAAPLGLAAVWVEVDMAWGNALFVVCSM